MYLVAIALYGVALGGLGWWLALRDKQKRTQARLAKQQQRPPEATPIV
ncbi:MAG TPA: hypothetical protein VN867_01905 [Candidatus Binataceae bacterium]|jgi:hypothetical protein|nr:hypothetical protein [Candidatus Binataceae bacterium]